MDGSSSFESSAEIVVKSISVGDFAKTIGGVWIRRKRDAKQRIRAILNASPFVIV